MYMSVYGVSRRVRRVHRRHERHPAVAFLPGAVSAQQVLRVADRGARAVPHHAQLHALRPRGKQRTYYPPCHDSFGCYYVR